MSVKPRVWYNFTAKGKDGEVKLRIQDSPQDRLGDVAHLFAQHFATEETFHVLAGIRENKEAIEEYEQLFIHLLQVGKVSICCEDVGSDTDTVGEIMAAGVMVRRNKGDPELKLNVKTRTKELTTFLTEILPGFKKYDIWAEKELDSIYEDKGVVVHPKFRGLGIAQRMFNVRRKICRDEGVTMTGAWMTAFGSQKAAERDGWETAYEISYEELEKKMDVTFKTTTPPTCKYMITKP